MSKTSTASYELIPGQETTQRSGKPFLLLLVGLVGFVCGVLFFKVVPVAQVGEPAINMALASPTARMFCLNVPTASVSAMQNTLRKNGVAPSPLERFALTSFAAVRDVSMKAQVKEEFSKLDPVTQAKLRKLGKEVVVRAAAFDPEDMPGVSAPLGFWDPAGFAKDEESFFKYRQAEIKHGRVCMSSSLGMLVADKFHPIYDNWNEGPFVSVTASHFSETATKNFWPAFWIMTAGHEIATTFADYEGKEEFDYGFDPLNLRPEDPEKALEYKTMELNHGRWAMFCAAGILAQELVTGKSVI